MENPTHQPSARRRVAVRILLLATLAGTPVFGGSGGSDLLERGRYLVERAGLCADCHSPRNERGEFVKERWLGGAPLGFSPAVPMPVWASVAPGIAGLPGWSVDQARTFLQTGERPTGLARPPMPAYRFNAADAEAIVAYLKSLSPPAGM